MIITRQLCPLSGTQAELLKMTREKITVPKERTYDVNTPTTLLQLAWVIGHRASRVGVMIFA